MKLLTKALKEIEGLDKRALEKAKKRLDTRMKPQESLGKLEKVALQVAGITGKVVNNVDRRCHLVASADNGIVDEGVSSCPVEYTRIVSEAMLNNVAAIGILCKGLGVDFKLVDIGIQDEIPRNYPNLYRKSVAKGTKNFRYEPAMTMDECVKAIETGIEMIGDLKGDYDIFSNGEMGIANTTTSSAVLYALTQAPLDEIVGRGGGLSDDGLIKKKRVIKDAVEKYELIGKDPVEILRHVGGLDIACMVGMYLGAAKYRKPMLIDGFISGVAALAAYKINPHTKDYMIATHKSEEPGVRVIMEELSMDAMLSMEMRLGEGTGAVLAYPIVSGAMEVIKGMKTVDEVYDLFG